MVEERKNTPLLDLSHEDLNTALAQTNCNPVSIVLVFTVTEDKSWISNCVKVRIPQDDYLIVLSFEFMQVSLLDGVGPESYHLQVTSRWFRAIRAC